MTPSRTVSITEATRESDLTCSLKDLIARSKKLQAHVRRLDATIYAPPPPSRVVNGNPVERQLGLLKAAFEDEAR